MKNRNNEEIDFVIYWVDGNDEEWKKEKQKHRVDDNQDGGDNRFRDWENLQYLFRGIEKYAKWVHKIYFITYGHLPKWLNEEHPQLVIVKHEEYLDANYIPTYSSRTIELNIHKIDGLSEQFVVFNDDFFILDTLKKSDFFKNGKPKDMLVEYPVMCGGNNPVFSNTLTNNHNMVGKYCDRKAYKKSMLSSILNVKYGTYFFYNLIVYLIPYPRFFGILTPHFARPYLKSSFEEVWEKEGTYLDNVCKHKFRTASDVNIYLVRNYNLMKGNFIPYNAFKLGKMFAVKKVDADMLRFIEKRKRKLICINDECESFSDFEQARKSVINSFEKILPERSKFEK